MDEMVRAPGIGEARVNVTWARQNGDMPNPVGYDATDEDIRTWAREAVRTGSVAGIAADENVDFTHFIVERFPAVDARPFNMITLRPKTEFG